MTIKYFDSPDYSLSCLSIPNILSRLEWINLPPDFNHVSTDQLVGHRIDQSASCNEVSKLSSSTVPRQSVQLVHRIKRTHEFETTVWTRPSAHCTPTMNVRARLFSQFP